MITAPEIDRLTAWFGAKIAGAENLSVEQITRPATGNSSDTLLLTLAWHSASSDHRQDFAVRLRPPSPGLLEPYDMRRQFEILRRLEGSDVRAPRVLWIESSAAVLGHEFYVMERLPGAVYEMSIPDEIRSDPEVVRRMCESMIEQLAAIHTVDIHATGLDTVADGRHHLEREIAHWTGEIDRVRRGPFPALEALASALREHQPVQSERIVLVHGDTKPGNLAFEGDEVSAVFDWEMATIGDPLTDLGWMENTWSAPRGLAASPGAPSIDDLLARYEELTGIPVRHREWYRALARFKLAVILLVGGALLEDGHSDDPQLAGATRLIHPMTRQGLCELGVDDEIESGSVLPNAKRVQAAHDRKAAADADAAAN